VIEYIILKIIEVIKMVRDMFLGKVDYGVIELDATATKEDIEFFKEEYPNSIVLKENSPFLKLIYSKLNSDSKISDLKKEIEQISKEEEIVIDYFFNKKKEMV
jgi:hypothetical protein